MQAYVFIGGGKDGLNIPAPDGAETVHLPVGVMDKESYARATLTVDDVSATIYIHESLTPEQALNRLVEYYRP
jgi:hypothetical protein